MGAPPSLPLEGKVARPKGVTDEVENDAAVAVYTSSVSFADSCPYGPLLPSPQGEAGAAARSGHRALRGVLKLKTRRAGGELLPGVTRWFINMCSRSGQAVPPAMLACLTIICVRSKNQVLFCEKSIPSPITLLQYSFNAGISFSTTSQVIA